MAVLTAWPGPYHPGDMALVWIGPVTAVTAAVILACDPPQFLSWAPLAQLGVISYSVYLWQQVAVNIGPLHAPWRGLLWSVIAILIAAASWQYVEHPIIARVHRRRQASLFYHHFRPERVAGRIVPSTSVQT